MMTRLMLQQLLILAITLLAGPATHGQANSRTIARCGDGWLETIDGYPVLHLKGTPWQMGYQHGLLLRQHVRQNLHTLLNVKGNQTLIKIGKLEVKPRAAIGIIQGIQRRHVPPRFFTELDGLASGAGLPRGDVRIANFIPELFHCSGFAVMNSATADGTLFHGRVLDYAIDWGLQDHAVLIVAEPDGGIPFVNVTYAGFIGSVTGMNARQVSIGEMGGSGLGAWNGVPMAVLVREVLQTAGDLDEAIAVFRDRPRTCQYYYVIADGKTNRAVGMEASWNTLTVVQPGRSHPRLPTPVTDCVLLSAGDRYTELVKRTRAGHGSWTATRALQLMQRPVAMKSNLHNVLFAPRSTKFWVSNASHDGQPAAAQPYHAFQLTELLRRQPAADAPRLALPAAPAADVSRPASSK